MVSLKEINQILLSASIALGEQTIGVYKMKSFKQYNQQMSEQVKTPIGGHGIKPGSVTIPRPFMKPNPWPLPEIDGYYFSGEYDWWGNPIYAPKSGSSIENYDDRIRALLQVATPYVPFRKMSLMRL